MDCIFCRIVRKELDAYMIYEDNDVVVILDKYPASKGHALVITRDHYSSVSETPIGLAAKSFAVASGLARYVRKVLKAPGVNILTNDGSQAGQMIYHFHIHVIPRWGGSSLLFHGRNEISRDEAVSVMRMYSGLKEYLESYLNSLPLP